MNHDVTLIATIAIGLVLAFVFGFLAQRLRLPPLETVAHVDLSRYLGTWYEIANFPQSFQRGCTASTATYTLRSDGDIDVVNRCRGVSRSGTPR